MAMVIAERSGGNWRVSEPACLGCSHAWRQTVGGWPDGCSGRGHIGGGGRGSPRSGKSRHPGANVAVLGPRAPSGSGHPVRPADGGSRADKHGIWHAPPILVSGATAYRAGSSSTRTGSTMTTAPARCRTRPIRGLRGTCSPSPTARTRIPPAPATTRTRPTWSSSGSSRPSSDRLPDHAQHAPEPAADRLLDRHRRAARPRRAVPVRGECQGAGQPVPDRPSLGDGSSVAGAGPREQRPSAWPDPRPRCTSTAAGTRSRSWYLTADWNPAPRHRPLRDGRRALGRGQPQLPAPPADRERHRARRRRYGRQSAGLLQRGLPLQPPGANAVARRRGRTRSPTPAGGATRPRAPRWPRATSRGSSPT